MPDLKKICNANLIHIEDIPQFVIHLMKTKTPYAISVHSLNGGLRCKYDYTSDKSISYDLEDFLSPYILRHLYSFQKETIKKGIEMHGRILINDDFGCGK